ncbi:hypothetical protein [Curtobacterium sp. MCBA15_004]|uniref:hypothetical protein n=1 Tax=unclassified Curtobacterium TaxID=257496 RepID=UPI0008DD86B7|nr:hypothetical protein [Curtobacterium sp. MCBA15_004]WIA97405.1 hypothetical protein QOL16_03140 [Curtobacterium sp. MCBA15_004]
MAKDRVLIVEQNSTGHRLFYARLLAQAALDRGAAVILLLHSDGDSRAEAVHLAPLLGRVDVLREPRMGLTEVSALSIRVRATRTVVPDGDRFALELARRRSWAGFGRISLLIMREHAQPRGDGGAARAIARVKSGVRTLAFRRVNGMSGVDLRVLKSAGWSGESRFAPAVDPVRVSTQASQVAEFRGAHGLRQDRYWFAVLGAISGRKNLDVILGGLQQVEAPWSLLVAGIIDTDVSNDVRTGLRQLEKTGSAVVIDRLLSDEELDAAVGAADCVVLAHSNEGPSGLLGKAAAVGTRVVAAGAISLQRDLAALQGLGEWTDLSVGSLGHSLSRATTLPAPVPVLRTGSDGFTDALL